MFTGCKKRKFSCDNNPEASHTREININYP